MYKRTYKNTDIDLSILGMGCMRLPKIDPEKTDIDEPAAEKVIDYAYQHGINYFDTAYPYHGHTSEAFVGRILHKYDRNSFYIATKMPVWMVSSEEDAKRIFDGQLADLQVDYIDFYLLHAANKERLAGWKKSGVYDFCRRMKEEGKIRHLGFSFHDTPDILAQIVDEYEFDFAQIQFNYLDWEFQDAKRQYEILTEHHLPVVVMEPVRGGTLADLCNESNAIFHQAKPNESVASWALRYAMSPENVMVVLSGMSSMDQVIDNVHTADDFQPLTDEERTVVAQALDAYKKNNTVPCTSCRYCQPCPRGVEIPRIFTIWNHYRIGKSANDFVAAYEALPEAARASSCVSCMACVRQCPQKIGIPEQLVRIQEEYEAKKA